MKLREQAMIPVLMSLYLISLSLNCALRPQPGFWPRHLALSWSRFCDGEFKYPHSKFTD